MTAALDDVPDTRDPRVRLEQDSSDYEDDEGGYANRRLIGLTRRGRRQLSGSSHDRERAVPMLATG